MDNSVRDQGAPTVIETVFFDGECGLCHGLVRFVLRRDRRGLFRFAPLESEAYRQAVPALQRAALGSTVVVLAGDGRILDRSTAVLHVMRRLGGVWRVLAWLAGWSPRGLRDAVYDLVARQRHRLVGRSAPLCSWTEPARCGRWTDTKPLA